MHHLGRVILRAQDVSGFEQRGKSPRTQLGECLQLPAWEERVSLHRRLGRRGERGRGKTREETGQGASQEGGSQVPRTTERSRGQSNKVKNPSDLLTRELQVPSASAASGACCGGKPVAEYTKDRQGHQCEVQKMWGVRHGHPRRRGTGLGEEGGPTVATGKTRGRG